MIDLRRSLLYCLLADASLAFSIIHRGNTVVNTRTDAGNSRTISNSNQLNGQHHQGSRISSVCLYAGGRSPSQPDKIDPSEVWEADPTKPSECRLIICQVTDVYSLEHFASFKTLVEETKKNSEGATVVSMLTGDFLSPYLLSSVDRGAGMMNALSKIPLDYLTWGNHEADIEHKKVCAHVRNFPGKWLNSNMLDHEAMDHQQEYDVIELTSPDGSQTRKVGLCAVLSDDEALYSHFKAPGAFGGATITDPWKALAKYKSILENDEGCDLVVPLQHLYVPDDHKTCRDFDFPVVLSGHDHHRVDEVVEGTRLLKPGMNAVYSTILEISWGTKEAEKPRLRARFVKCEDWEPDPVLQEENERAYDALIPLRNTELSRVPASFEPLSSAKARAEVCSMGRYICSLLRSSMNLSRRQRKHNVDAVLLMGGNIRGSVDEYPLGSFFSLEALEAEIKSDEVVGVVKMPGWLLAAGIEATHAGDPIPGWMQYDIGVHQDDRYSPPRVTHVGGQPLEPERIYRVATKISDLTNGQSEPLTQYYTENNHLLPPKGAYINIQSELMTYFARNLWRKIWEATTRVIDKECMVDDNCAAEARLDVLDKTGDGEVTVDELQDALRDLVGYSVDEREQSLAKFVHSFVDSNGDGTVRVEDIETYCDEIEDLYERDSWRLSSPKPREVEKTE
mmetsp:Transcript_16193/g.33498  ORF Transcript_16193/g.33498 Transcript_16193/m.33498 type:complete len:678 (-) Transcript_16193:119-2152(-)